MRKISCLLILLQCLFFAACSEKVTQNVSDKGTKWSWNGGTIVTEEPARGSDQQSVIGLTAPKMD
ncbi:MAG: glycosyl hydrolase, partial [Bacteroidales bacterium]